MTVTVERYFYKKNYKKGKNPVLVARIYGIGGEYKTRYLGEKLSLPKFV